MSQWPRLRLKSPKFRSVRVYKPGVSSAFLTFTQARTRTLKGRWEYGETRDQTSCNSKGSVIPGVDYVHTLGVHSGPYSTSRFDVLCRRQTHALATRSVCGGMT
jgi:hypothetical protein